MRPPRPEGTRTQKFWILLLNAMTRPLAAATLAITIVIGLTISYWFLLVGALFYALIVYTSLQDPEESRQVLNEVLYPDKARKPDLDKLSGDYRTALQRAMNTRRKIQEAVTDTSDPAMRKALADSTDDLEDMVRAIYDIALKAQSIQTSLKASNVNAPALEEEIRRLRRTIETTRDDFARSQYEATLASRHQQLQNYRDTQDALQRWEAQLDNALATLDTILSQVLRIRASEVLTSSAATDQVSTILREEVESLKATSDALDSVYGMSTPK